MQLTWRTDPCTVHDSILSCHVCLSLWLLKKLWTNFCESFGRVSLGTTNNPLGMLIPGKFVSRVRKWIFQDPFRSRPQVTNSLLHVGRLETNDAGQLYNTFPVSQVALFISVIAVCSCLSATLPSALYSYFPSGCLLYGCESDVDIYLTIFCAAASSHICNIAHACVLQNYPLSYYFRACIAVEEPLWQIAVWERLLTSACMMSFS